MKKITFLIISLLSVFHALGQKDSRDSIFQVAHKAEDTMAVKAYITLTGTVLDSDPSAALAFTDSAFNLAKKIKYTRGVAFAYHYRATIYQDQGFLTKAIENLVLAQGLYKKLGDHKNSASVLSNMGNIYFMTNELDKALQYYNEALALHKEVKNKSGSATALNNIASVYATRKEYDKANEMYNHALKLRTEVGDSAGMATTLLSIGQIFEMKNENDEAERYYHRVLELCERNKIYHRELSVLQVLAAFNRRFDRIDKSLVFAKRGYDLATAMQSLAGRKTAAEQLYQIYQYKGDYKKGFEYYREFIQLRDSMYNTDNARKITQAQMGYEFDLREKADSIKNAQHREKEELKHQQAIHRQQLYTYGGIIGFGLMLVVAIVSFRAFRQKKKANTLIQEQKNLVEEKQNEILGSITYAKRLQQAILATPEEIRRHLPNTLLFYKPKDIVAGDFYFFETTASHVFIAAADCTGHGVPGAMVSIVCSNALTRCVKEFGLSDPGKILDKTSELVTETFDKSGTDVKDGMDISLLAIHTSTGEIKWAGAHNALWFTHRGAMNEITATKRPVGKSDNMVSFTTHTVKPEKGETIFLFTDGYADQFGGPSGKKFKNTNLKNLLLLGSALSIEEQYKKLNIHFNEWKGSLEQIDDICILGIRI